MKIWNEKEQNMNFFSKLRSLFLKICKNLIIPIFDGIQADKMGFQFCKSSKSKSVLVKMAS